MGIELSSPSETFFRGFSKWYVWVILFIVLVFWLIRVDRDMKENSGSGLFDDLWG